MTFSRSFVLSSAASAQPPGTHQVVQRTATRGDAVLSAPPRSAVTRRDNARRYSIEIKDATTEKSVCAVAVDWTEYEKRLAVARIMRLAGPADDSD